MSVTVDDRAALLARAAHVRPLLQRNAAAIDAGRRLTDEVVETVRDEGFCRLMVPRRCARMRIDTAVAATCCREGVELKLEVYGKALLGVEPNITPLI